MPASTSEFKKYPQHIIQLDSKQTFACTGRDSLALTNGSQRQYLKDLSLDNKNGTVSYVIRKSTVMSCEPENISEEMFYVYLLHEFDYAKFVLRPILMRLLKVITLNFHTITQQAKISLLC